MEDTLPPMCKGETEAQKHNNKGQSQDWTQSPQSLNCALEYTSCQPHWSGCSARESAYSTCLSIYWDSRFEVMLGKQFSITPQVGNSVLQLGFLEKGLNMKIHGQASPRIPPQYFVTDDQNSVIVCDQVLVCL